MSCTVFTYVVEFDMDHPIYMPYSPPNGVPQESKLATYMVREVTAHIQSYPKIFSEPPESKHSCGGKPLGAVIRKSQHQFPKCF